MPKKLAPKRTLRFNVRLTEANSAYADREIKEGHFASRNAYFNALLDKQRAGRDSLATELQDAIVATMNQMRKDMQRDLRGMKHTGDVTSAFLHALARMLVVTLPEPDPETRKLLNAKAAKKYESLLVNASKELIENRGSIRDDGEDN